MNFVHFCSILVLQVHFYLQIGKVSPQKRCIYIFYLFLNQKTVFKIHLFIKTVLEMHFFNYKAQHSERLEPPLCCHFWSTRFGEIMNSLNKNQIMELVICNRQVIFLLWSAIVQLVKMEWFLMTFWALKCKNYVTFHNMH